jgi:hypothetical protein
MIRFIDLDDQITEGDNEFAFYDTVTDRFVEIFGSVTWPTVRALYNDVCASMGKDPETMPNKDIDFYMQFQRYFSLVPIEKWDKYCVTDLSRTNEH